MFPLSKIKTATALIFLCLFFTFPISGQEEVEPMVGGIFVGDLTVEPRLLSGGESLTLDEVTRLSILRNLDMRMARLDRSSEHFRTPIARAVYDTQLEVSGTYTHDRHERTSVVSGSREIEGIGGVSLEKKIPLGTTVKIEGQTSRHSSGSSFSNFPRYYESTGTILITQPLLRNFFGYIDRSEIKKVKLDVKKFDFETADTIEQTIADVRLEYWDLKFFRENLLTKRKALRKAQNFLKITRDKLDIGLTEKPDVYAAEANVRKRVLEVLEAENEFLTHSYILKVMLDLPEINFIVPVEEPKFSPLKMDYENELAEAYERRRDLKALELKIEGQEIERKIKWNERLPELEVQWSLTPNGLDRDMADSQGEVFGVSHNKYFAGVTLSTALELREERALYNQAKLGLKKLYHERDKLKLEIARELDESLRGLELASEEVRQTREIDKLQRQKLEVEEKNFNRGRSDSKTIIDYQEDVIQSETEAIQALVNYEKAVQNFYRTTHQLIDRVSASDNEVP